MDVVREHQDYNVRDAMGHKLKDYAMERRARTRIARNEALENRKRHTDSRMA